MGRLNEQILQKEYIELLKENGQWKVSIYKPETYPKLYKEVLVNKL